LQLLDCVAAQFRAIILEQLIVRHLEFRPRTQRPLLREERFQIAKPGRPIGPRPGAVTGERRKLSKAELNDLRKRGPAGEALVLRALADLSKAKKTNNRVAMDAALYALASAAVSWKERL